MAKTYLELTTKDDKNCPDYQNLISMTIHEDGAVSFSKDMAENYIYLYPDQVRRVLQECASIVPKLSPSEAKE